jgi:hypothetical protein
LFANAGSFSVKLTDLAGNTSLSSTSTNYTYDYVVPAAPNATITTADDGRFNYDRVASSKTATLSVTGAETLSTIIVFDNGIEINRYTLTGAATSYTFTVIP